MSHVGDRAAADRVGRAHADREARGADAGGSRRADCRGEAKSGAVLAVGHSERFNPAVAAARPYVNDPRFIEVHRLGTQLGRSLDIDVVLDLMIHDLDLILSLVPSEVESVEAVGVPVLTPKVDIANARRAVRERLHREPDGQPHQPRSDPQDSLLPARALRVDRYGGARGGDVSAGAAGGADCRRSTAAS